MLQKPYFKIFIWFVTSSFFFMASAILIANLRVGPTEQEVMQYMSGMMGAMQNSLMGLSMTIESDMQLMSLIRQVSIVTMPIIVFSIIAAILVRFIRGNKND